MHTATQSDTCSGDSLQRPLRFCHLSIFYPPYSFGGDAVYVQRLCESLARQGHEVHVIHCVDSYQALGGSGSLPPLDPIPNLTVHSLRSGWGALSPLLSQQTGAAWFKSKAIREVLDSTEFDVIHYHNTSLFGAKVLEITPRTGRFVKVYSAHEHWLVCPMHVLWKNNRELCETPACIRCSLHFQRPPQWWRATGLLPRATAAVDAFLSPSRFSIRLHQERGFTREMEHLPLFVPTPESKQPRRKPHPRPYFLFVGRLEQIKGLQEVIPVFRKYPDADLLVAGKGNFQAELRRLAGEAKNIIFLGHIPPDQLGALYQNAIAVVVPSLCYEVFPLVVVEASAHGVPVVAHAVGALSEMVEHGVRGLTYTSTAGLLDALEELRTKPELRNELAHNAYRHYATMWSEDTHLAAYFDILTRTATRKYGFVPWRQQALLAAAQ